jgi:ADP-glucose pyrophosphorylase
MIDQSCVGRNCVIDKASIVDTILYDRVRIASGVQLTRCVIGEGCSIESDVRLHDVVVGDGEIISSGTDLNTSIVWTKAKPEGYPEKQIGNPLKED